MPNESMPRTNNDLAAWALRFAAVAADNASVLGLSPEQIIALETTANEFEISLRAMTRAKATYQGSVSTKNTARGQVNELFRAYGQAISSNPEVSPNLKAKLGMVVTPRATPSLQPPLALASDGFANGENRLVWDRNGNSRGTIFMIEACYGRSKKWTFVAVTTRIRFIHKGQQPGRQVIYRVHSQRSKNISGSSNESIVYSGMFESEELRVA